MDSKTMKLHLCAIVALCFLVGLDSKTQSFQKTEYGITSTVNSIEVGIQC
jgi:hypothetical protein